MPNDLIKKAGEKFAPLVTTPQDPDPGKTLDAAGVPWVQSHTRYLAHVQAEKAGGFQKHGANDNMVHSKSSAIAPHDKGR